MITVWVNGCFDVLTYAHIQLLEFASDYGDKLIVGIDSDERIKDRKGVDRPFHDLYQRKQNLMAIRFVGYVCSFSTDDELSTLVKRFSPDIMIVGEEYKNKKVIGSEYAKQLIFFPKIEGFSTTKILNSIL